MACQRPEARVFQAGEMALLRAPEWDRSSVAKEGPERQVSGLEQKEHRESQSGGW